MGFRFDTMHLRPDQKAIISQRDKNNKSIDESKKNTKEQSKIQSDISIFMRLGNDYKTGLNGFQTMEIYDDFCRDKGGQVWFSTNALINGMSKQRTAYFLKEISDNKTVYIYFAIGRTGGGRNEIEYRAEVVDVVSQAEEIKCPKDKLVPDIWKDRVNRIWVKIKNLKKYNEFKTTDFIVESSGNILAKSIERSEYHFGYIKRN